MIRSGFTGTVTGKSEGADGEGFVGGSRSGGSNSLGDHVSGTADAQPAGRQDSREAR